jgi:cellulose synthase/poly-beta-1,6-N-acetylglucosamine synthase-like glycosyltransferase
VRTTPAELEILLRHRLLPLGEGLGYATADAPTGRLGLAALGLQPEAVRLVLAEPDALDAALLHRYGPALAERASTRPPLALSARAPVPWRQRTGLAALIAAAVAAEIVLPEWRGAGLFVFLVLLNAMNAVVRIAVLGAALGAGARSAAAPPPGIVALSDRRPLPRISLLVPLLREPEVLPVLLRALDALDWPRELLDVIVILETGDTATMAEIDRLGLPPWARVLVLPPGGPRTKPRALNLALDFARGDVIGLYDAEDRPEPDQLRRVAAILRDSPADVACVQCHLSYYNTRENWLTRCFTLEYAMWFDVLIAGFDRLRLPIPLGGTSVFFRRAALERVGGWDAHNVTEDADLGMRLARMGYRCVVAESTTHEEANSRLGPWVRQRSRWLKGYMTTWLVHMRSPLRLWRDLGTRGFLAFQALFLGAAVAYLGLPVFWAVWGAALLGHGPGWLIASPLWLIVVLGVVQLSGWLAMLAAALIATARRRQWWLQPWVPTLAVYWPLGALAAYLALAELVVAPAHWRKTRHGVGRLAAAERAEALSMREDSAKAARRAAG